MWNTQCLPICDDIAIPRYCLVVLIVILEQKSNLLTKLLVHILCLCNGAHDWKATPNDAM